MSAASAEPDQPTLRQYRAGRRSSAQNGMPNPEKLAIGFTLMFSTLAALTVGIAIGNAARKRIDRWAHGSS